MKTSELTGAALDWAVAKCEGVNDEAFRLYYEPTESTDYDSHGYPEFHYSTVWAQGGPIIERERITLEIKHDGWWVAMIYNVNDDPRAICLDHSPLIAAMRCYVASKLGDLIKIPKELL